MSNNSASDEVQRRINQIFVNPAVSAQVADIVIRKKPPGWSRKSQAPYFKECFGQEMKEVFDAMIKDRLDRVFSLEKFPKLKMDTIYLRVNQSIRFLLTYLDDADKTYARFCEMIHVTKDKGVGVRLSFLEGTREREVLDFTPVPVMPKADEPLWKEKLDTFLEEGAVGVPFHIEGLALNSEQIRDIKLSVAQLKGVMLHVTAHSIKAIKINVEPDAP